MTSFARHAFLLFLSLRIGDLVSLAAGLWFVPRYVSSADLGAVLPVTSFATTLSIPAFAFGFVFMREASILATQQAYGQLKSLIRGVFIGMAGFLTLSLIVAGFILPIFLQKMRVTSATTGFLVLAAAFLGCVAPVYTDALNALKRFRTLGLIEVLASFFRVCVMMLTMPFSALTGYFAGSATQPLVRMAGALVVLRSYRTHPAQPYWEASVWRHLLRQFLVVTLYQLLPMMTHLVELSVLRTRLSDTVSAGYFLATRFSDLLNTVTFPLLLVLFPHATEATTRGESTRPYVLQCAAVTLVLAAILALIYAFLGEWLLTLLPNARAFTSFAAYLPWLLALNALTACQNFCTNTEIAAGRMRFFIWFIPLHVLYPLALYYCSRSTRCFEHLLLWLTLASFLRFIGALITTTPCPKMHPHESPAAKNEGSSPRL